MNANRCQSDNLCGRRAPAGGRLPWLLVAGALTAWAGLAGATDSGEFDLFDAERGERARPEASPEKAAAPEAPAPRGPQADFVLRGTGRIGERYTVTLQDPGGKDIHLRLGAGQPTEVEGHPGYHVVSVSAREVIIAYPENAPCRRSAQDKGVYCSEDGTQATLTLARRAPTQPPEPTAEEQAAAQQQAQSGEQQDKKAVNPFLAAFEKARQRARELQDEQAQDPEAAARRRELEQQARDGKYQGFKPNRIDEADVPPGMRVVRTPFGDRLVPIKQE